MKLKIQILFLILIFITGCSIFENAENHDFESDPIIFTDDLGRNVTVYNSRKTAVLSGSLAEIWLLSGGTLFGVTADAYDDHLFQVPDETVNYGALKSPSLEMMIADNIDFVILSSKISEHVDLYETLTDSGITAAYFNVEGFEDYLRVLKICTEITGMSELYEKNGTSIQSHINTVIENVKDKELPTVLYLRAFSTGIKAKGDDTIAGKILADLGCRNIADINPSLLEDLSMEEIIKQDPDFVFITTMGEDEKKAMESFETKLSSNPAWGGLTAVQNDRCIVLPKNMYHYKPNSKWGEAYENLAEILYG